MMEFPAVYARLIGTGIGLQTLGEAKTGGRAIQNCHACSSFMNGHVISHIKPALTGLQSGEAISAFRALFTWPSV